MSDTPDENFRGNLAAMEFMMGQLYLMALSKVADPQAWIDANLTQMATRLSSRDQMSDGEKAAAQGTVRRIMQAAAWMLEAKGRGKAFEVQ